MKLVEEGCADGLKTQEACEAVGITDRTYRNWKRLGDDDGRTKRTNFTSGVCQGSFSTESNKKAVTEIFCRRPLNRKSEGEMTFFFQDTCLKKSVTQRTNK